MTRLVPKSTTPPLVPPRPNLGPEPWPGPDLIPQWLPALALVVGLLGLAVWWIARHRRRGAGAASAPSMDELTSPRQRIIVRAEAVRNVLIARFGPTWLARTTEEIAEEPVLAEAFGPDRARQLVRFLRLADRAKFALDEADDLHGEDWEAWTAEFLALAAGARSRIMGR